MGGLIVLGILAMLWVIVGPIIALVSASRANRRADDLQRRLSALEALARDHGCRRLTASPSRNLQRHPRAPPSAKHSVQRLLSRLPPARSNLRLSLSRSSRLNRPPSRPSPKPFRRSLQLRPPRREATRIARVENRRALDCHRRRARAGARCDFPRPLFDRAGTARPGRADHFWASSCRRSFSAPASGCADATAR